MRHPKRWIGAGAAAVAVAGAIAAMGVASARHDEERPITGDALERASAVALEDTGGGTVTGTEVGDEEGYYEVEVTLDDGTQVDVHLDQDFAVLGDESDGTGDDGD
ncbi:PepSY domain-containing protein [Jiangella mangrovi]|uniref:Putative membrane protein YkoI n=1 Tax=Jiangella mangrovi TaxID=1524084 RepID=A0A7W9GY39_9ACTN|nr:PepSY domain-containing protein [Jiangella mangrovi]MBB5791873.1 putative membrane protein YkoI [Jiangella mangrovi]